MFLEVGLNISKLWFNISNWILDTNFNCWVQLCFYLFPSLEIVSSCCKIMSQKPTSMLILTLLEIQHNFFSNLLVFTKVWMQVPSPHLALQSSYSFLPSSHKMDTSICNEQLENSPCDSLFNVGFIRLTFVSNSTNGILWKKPLTLIILT